MAAQPAGPGGGFPFEPTGQLQVDYLAYCEIDHVEGRKGILDSIIYEEDFAADGSPRAHTGLHVRNAFERLHRGIMCPIALAIPHCYNLRQIRLSSTNITTVAYRMLIQAVWRSATVFSVWVDFHPRGLLEDPCPAEAAAALPSATLAGLGMPRSTIVQESDADGSPKSREDFFLYPAEAGCGGLVLAQPEGADAGATRTAAKEKPKTVAGKKGGKPTDEEPVAPKPVVIPEGFGGILVTRIQHLSLRGNSITDAEVEQMCGVLETHPTLASLSLWGNLITDAGAAHLATMLRVNRTLTSLNLGHNCLTDAAVGALARCFQPLVVTH
eukprot:RCo044325